MSAAARTAAAAAVAALALAAAGCGSGDDGAEVTTGPAPDPVITRTTPAPVPGPPATAPPAASTSTGSAPAPTTSTGSAPAPTTVTDPPQAPPGPATTIPVAADPGGAFAFTESELTGPAGTVVLRFTNDSDVPHNIALKGAGASKGPTRTVSGGASARLSVRLPAGAYIYYCAIPGHEAAGMSGVLVVK